MSHIEEHSAGLSEYEQYVLDALYCQETQTLGRELTLGERRKIRTEHIEALRRAAPPKKRGYKRTARADEIKILSGNRLFHREKFGHTSQNRFYENISA